MWKLCQVIWKHTLVIIKQYGYHAKEHRPTAIGLGRLVRPTAIELGN